MLRDFRYGARLLWQARSFSAVALLALALGSGATTAMFSVVDAVLLKPLPFRDPERLLVIYEKNPAQNKFKLFVAPANYFAWRDCGSLQAEAAVQRGGHINLTGGPNGYLEPEELQLERASATLFPLLGVQPAVGRLFTAEEDQPGRANVALLSHRLWQRRFGADLAIAGKTIRLRDQSYTVAGVMPAGFSVLDTNVDLWLPLGLNPADPRTGSARMLTVVARLRPGVNAAGARRELDAVGERQEQANPALNKGWRPSVFALQDELVGDVKRPLEVLTAAVGFLLLMACVNVANLLLARAGGRRREIAVRTALGAGRGRVVRQLLAESVLLSVAGAALGLLLAAGCMLLARQLGPATIPRLAEARLNGRVFVFALATSIATGLLFGIAPALQASGTNLNEALTEGGRGGTLGRRSRILRAALVISEVALAVIVLIGAGLLIRSFVRLRSVDPGFRAENLLTFRVPMPGGRGPAV
ncbi:MAG TPA: ABC transporter permease, partial [Bryobacteraceae bacterium]